ncbi:MAG: sodium:proton antiporter [Ilumatobacter sp.]
MNGFLIIVVGCLAAVGTYLVTSRALSRIVLGFAMLGHAVVLAIVTSGGSSGAPPLADKVDGRNVADPLPQALSLTAIVISFGLTLFLLALALRQRQLSGDDLVEDDLEDRRIAMQSDQSPHVESDGAS